MNLDLELARTRVAERHRWLAGLATRRRTRRRSTRRHAGSAGAGC